MSRLPELQAKVDAFFARVAARHGADMQCASGCADCCHARLTITAVEAAAIRQEVATWPASQRRALADTGPADRCAALGPDDRCRIYAARPLVCRSHGVPVKLHKNSLPVVCPKNFRETAADPDCVLDQATLSTVLLAVDRAEHPAAARVDLAALLADLALC
ncbi:MAG TPA: YkgJ family cysteine cluster protein [Kofleriaceae bacterium]